MSTQKVSRFRN